jgi:hypothetical protein
MVMVFKVGLWRQSGLEEAMPDMALVIYKRRKRDLS